MREQTVQIETVLGGISQRLEAAGGVKLEHALQQMHGMKRFLAACVACGAENELQIAMERAGLGDLAEALLPVLRR
jgi:hypothetical protein